MPEVKNTTDQPIEATTGHVVPANGSLDVSSAVLARLKSEPYTAMKFRKGHLTADLSSADAKEGEITRVTVAKANRNELVNIIAGHSDYDAGDLSGITVEDKGDEDGLRTIAARLVFGD